MVFSSNLLENAVNEFAKLPGIGKKTALRLVLHLIKKQEAEVLQFSDAISQMRQKIKFCKVSIKDGTMLIEAKSKVDLTLEEWTFAGKATFFEEVYGLKAILERVSE